MCKKIYIIIFVLILSLCLNAQKRFSVETFGCGIELSFNVKKKGHKKWFIESSINITNYDTSIKYFPFRDTNLISRANNFLFSYNEFLYESNITEFYIGTYNELHFPKYYSKIDSVYLLPLLPKKQLRLKIKSDIKLNSKNLMTSNQVNIIIRFISNPKKNIEMKLGLQDYLDNSSTTIIRINKEKAKDAIPFPY